jgi:hypothetical protein
LSDSPKSQITARRRESGTRARSKIFCVRWMPSLQEEHVEALSAMRRTTLRRAEQVQTMQRDARNEACETTIIAKRDKMRLKSETHLRSSLAAIFARGDVRLLSSRPPMPLRKNELLFPGDTGPSPLCERGRESAENNANTASEQSSTFFRRSAQQKDIGSKREQVEKTFTQHSRLSDCTSSQAQSDDAVLTVVAHAEQDVAQRQIAVHVPAWE